MAKLEVTENQLHLIQRALDFYSRIGIGQFTEIKNHPTFENHIENICRPNKSSDVGDSTAQGKILEIDKDNKKALINGSVKNGRWCKDKEWKPLSEVVLSPYYTKYHELRDRVDNVLKDPRNMLVGEDIPTNGSWGINHKNVDDSCREAFDIIQVIRHEFWKRNENRSDITVDSSIHFTSNSGESNKIKCEL